MALKKIGFTAEIEHEDKRTLENVIVQKEPTIIKKSIVKVYFPDRNLTCSFYNDMFNLKRGDIVYVEGKLEGKRGRVVDINYNFKIKLSDYKRIIGVADTNVIGEFHLADSHFITIDEGALKYEQIASWFKAPEKESEEYVSSSGEEVFNLNDLGGMNIKKEVAERGHEYYMENRVVYIELNHGKGRALVTGRQTYDVEFFYKDEDITGLVCNCYCTGTCKHEFATMLQLRDILAIIKSEYPFVKHNDYLAAVSKARFFEFVIDGNTKGTFTMG